VDVGGTDGETVDCAWSFVPGFLAAHFLLFGGAEWFVVEQGAMGNGPMTMDQ
jgi:hypothetical protein